MKFFVLISAALVIIFIAAGLLFPFPFVFVSNGQAHRAQAKTEVTGFVAALRSYRVEYGALPAGDAAEVMTALRGQNMRKIVFFEARPTSFKAKGELVDPWGSTYRFDTTDPEKMRVWSCGTNRRDENGAEGSDDIVSWR